MSDNKYDKKPELKDYNLTIEMVNNNQYAKKNRRTIIDENDKIERLATKSGWITFFVGIGIAIVIAVSGGLEVFSWVSAILGVVGGLLFHYCIKSNTKPVPTFSKQIEDRYNQYLKDLENYNKRQAQREERKLAATQKTIETKQKEIPIKLPKKVSEPPKATPTYAVVYENSGIGLTSEQAQLFMYLLAISKKYCPDVEISEWRYLVGVGVIQQEHLRYWLHKTKGNIYIKFADSKKDILFDVKNRSDIVKYTKQVNEEYEKDPEKYLLEKYKAKQEQQQQTEKDIFKENKAKEDGYIFGTDDDEDIIYDVVDVKDVAEETPKTEQTETIDTTYDKNIFVIKDKVLKQFIGTSTQSVYEIPDFVEEIANNAFSGNNYVYELTIPTSIKSIGNNAFKDCKKLRMLTLPGSIEQIGTNVFSGCDNLETLFVETKAVRKLLKDVPKSIEIVCLEF